MRARRSPVVQLCAAWLWTAMRKRSSNSAMVSSCGCWSGQGEQHRIELAPGQLLHEGARLRLADLQVERRILTGHLRQDVGQQIGRDRRDDPEPQGPCQDAMVLARVIRQFPHLIQDRLGPCGDFLAG